MSFLFKILRSFQKNFAYPFLARKDPANTYLLKVNNRKSRKRCEICSKLTIKTPERRLLVFLLLTLNNKINRTDDWSTEFSINSFVKVIFWSVFVVCHCLDLLSLHWQNSSLCKRWVLVWRFSFYGKISTVIKKNSTQFSVYRFLNLLLQTCIFVQFYYPWILK